MIPPNSPKPLNILPPVPLQLRRNSRPIQQLAACLRHSRVCCFARVLGECARGVGDDEDVVAVLEEGEGGEGDADFG